MLKLSETGTIKPRILCGDLLNLSFTITKLETGPLKFWKKNYVMPKGSLEGGGFKSWRALSNDIYTIYYIQYLQTNKKSIKINNNKNNKI